MTIERYIPPDSLKPFIKDFMLIECKREMDNFTLPDTSVVMALRLNGTTSSQMDGPISSLLPLVLSGIRTRPRSLHYEKNTANLLVIFKDGGAAPFIKTPINELVNSSINLNEFLPADKIHQMEDRLPMMKINQQLVAYASRVLLSIINENRVDPLINDVVQEIQQSNGQIKTGKLASHYFISQDAFEKRFRKTVGTSPKQFAKIIKLRKLIAEFDDQKSLTSLALDAGYFDQAHFIKDFKAFAGKTPSEFFKSSVFW